MWIQARPSEPKIREEIETSSSYVNNKGIHPKIGTCICPQKVVFNNVQENELKDDEWKFLPHLDSEIKSDIFYLDETCHDIIVITK